MKFDENGKPLLGTETEWTDWFILNPVPKRTEDEWTALEYNLPLELVPEFNRLKVAKFGDWPPNILKHVCLFSAQHGACGETIVAGIADWLRTYGVSPTKSRE